MRYEEHNFAPAERDALLGMIFSRSILGEIAARWRDPGLFDNAPANQIGSWCVKHYREHSAPPRKGIVSYLEQQNGDGRHAEAEMTERKLRDLLDHREWQNGKINSGRVIALAREHFNQVELRKLAEGIGSDLDAGRTNKALGRVAEFSQVEMGAGKGCDLFLDKEAVTRSLSPDKSQPLFEYGQKALDQFFRFRLQRGAFLAFMGPDKVGKTTWLVDLAWRAMLNRLRVAFFEVGDDTEDEIHQRFMVRASGHPFMAGAWPLEVALPTAIRRPGKEEACAQIEETRVKRFKAPLSAEKGWAVCEKVMRTKLRSGRSFFKSSCHDSLSVGIEEIRSTLRSWGRTGWNADVVVIDYADNLAPPAGTKQDQKRDQNNRTWQLMRATSQELNCLLVTATQADAESYDRRTLDRRNFSEDKRKLAHVTAMIGINVISEEKEKGISRLNVIVGRKGAYSTRRCVHCAGCWDVGNPCVVSCW